MASAWPHLHGRRHTAPENDVRAFHAEIDGDVLFTQTALDLSTVFHMSGKQFELDEPANRIRVNLPSPGIDDLANGRRRASAGRSKAARA